MAGAKLKKYKLVNVQGLGQIRADFGMINLATITDAQAEKLFNSGSRYVAKVEKPAGKPRTPKKTE